MHEQGADSFTPVRNHIQTVCTTLRQFTMLQLINMEKHDYHTPVGTSQNRFILVCAVDEQFQGSPNIVHRQRLFIGSSKKSLQQKWKFNSFCESLCQRWTGQKVPWLGWDYSLGQSKTWCLSKSPHPTHPWTGLTVHHSVHSRLKSGMCLPVVSFLPSMEEWRYSFYIAFQKKKKPTIILCVH